MIHNTESKQHVLKQRSLQTYSKIAIIPTRCTSRQVFYFLHIVCLTCDKFLTWSGLVPIKYAGGFCRMADRLTNTIRTHKHSAPSLCFSRHTSLNYFSHSYFTTRSSFSHYHEHTRKNGVGCTLCTQRWGCVCHSENPDSPLLECKIPGVQRVGCQLEGSHCLSKAAGLDQRARERDGGYGAGQSGGCGGWCVFQQKWRFNIWSLLEWVRHSALSITPFSKVASRNCGGREKPKRDQRLQ